jgi:quercetin dioxygenase-like cupin family protein
VNNCPKLQSRESFWYHRWKFNQSANTGNGTTDDRARHHFKARRANSARRPQTKPRDRSAQHRPEPAPHRARRRHLHDPALGRRHRRSLLPNRHGHHPRRWTAAHWHDFAESFTLLEGEIEATFRGEKSVVRAGETINISANAPHSFTNAFKQTVRLLCLCVPAGQEEFFVQVGVPVATHMTTPPKLDKTDKAAAMKEGKGTCTQVPHGAFLSPIWDFRAYRQCRPETLSTSVTIGCALKRETPIFRALRKRLYRKGIKRSDSSVEAIFHR